MTILKKLLYIVSALGLLVLLFVIFSNSIPSQTPREKSLDTLPELEPPNSCKKLPRQAYSRPKWRRLSSPK